MSTNLPEPGDFAALFRSHDWAATPLGPRAAWPAALRTLAEVLLGSRQPMFVAWGPALTLVYNESYAEILALKHPALGQPFLEVWSEIRDDLSPLVEQARAGISVHMADIPLLMTRRGYPEETHFSFSYTPVRDTETGAVAGFFCACNEITAQVLAERRVRESEAELRGVLDGMGEGFVLLDRDFRVRQINAEGLRLDGREPAAIVGRHLLEAWPEAVGRPHWPMFQRVMAERTAGRVVFLRGWGDREVWLDSRAFPSGEGVAVFYRDVTSEKHAEEALRDSEAQFRALAQAIPNQAWIAAPDGNLTWFNQQVHVYSGRSSAALAGQGWAAIVHADDLAPATAAWAHALATGEPYQAEFRLLRADGAYRWHLARAQAIRGEDGGITLWVGTNTDIEYQRRATEALAGMNAELERRVSERTAERDRVWRNSRDLLVVVGADGVFRAVNPAWTAILGHRPEEVEGHSFLDFIWPEDAALTQGGLDDAAARRDLTNFENRFRHKDGSPRWIAWHTSVEGDLVFGYGRDVTAQKEQAEALQRAEEALRQSQKMEAVGQLTGGLAHDFNNLLTGIAGSLELMQARIEQGRFREIERFVAAAQGATKRAAALTHRLLAFSRRQTLDPKPVGINRLVADMAELIRRTAGPQITVEVVAAGGLWTTLVDPNQLENALLNLCINARDAMPDGGRLTIETANRWLDQHAGEERGLPTGQYVSLCVSDSGTGMTAEVQRRAFDPFFTTKPIGQGTGLGLSMIYGFVQQSGGQARIYSELGHGATICLYLPRHVGEAELLEARTTPAARARAGSGETVLIVDDEPTVRMLAAEVLQELGYTAIEVDDGAAGLRVLQTDRRVDLLVTDVGLPGGLNGRQVADAGRALRPGLKVLFITGYAENAVISHGHLEPGMQMLTKPFALDALAARIKELIGGDGPPG